jgi:hypothetical protein
MIHLNTRVLGPFGEMVPVGAFLHAPDRPAWTHTTDVNGVLAPIRAATVVDAEDFPGEALCIVIESREKAPLIAHETTRLWSLDQGGFVPLSKLAVMESVRVPDVTRAGVVVTWSKIKRILPASLEDRLFLSENRMWGRLVLARGSYSWASPCAFVHQ